MKRLIIMLLSFIPIFTTAQTLSEAQRQEALQCATKFCNLLERFCNGERTLNSQINALCSGADCSAYDDVKANKEITLRNYLYAIQAKFPNKLATSISAPSLSASKTYIEPVMSLNYEWGNVGNSDLSTAEIASLSLASVSNVFVVFDVTQKYPSLNNSINKKIVYDVKNKKITAFITNNGAFINFLNGVLAFSNKQFKSAITYLKSAAQNDRSSLKKKSYGLAMLCAWYIQDFEQATYFAEQMGDQLYINAIKLILYSQNEQYEDTYQCALQLEALIKKRTDLNNMMKSNLYLMLGNCYVNPLFSHQDLNKGISYMEAAYNLGDTKAGYYIFVYFTHLGEDFVTTDIALEYLQKSAEGGFPPAFYQWGRMVEYGLKDKEEALVWYDKSAKSGNHIAMASAGKLLIEKGEVAKGVEWLKKSLEGQALETELKDNELTTGGLAPWPKTRADVESLLNKQGGTTIHQNQSSTNNQSTYSNHSDQTSSTTGAGGTTSTYSSYSSNYQYRYRHKFNEAKDNYCVGLSVGYVQKQWVYDFDGSKEKVNVFGDGQYTNGIQAGIRIDPQFGYGFGINTGLYYEYYFDKSEDMYEDGINYYYRSEEHSLYLPIHLKYSLNFSKWFQIALYGGLGLDCGINGNIYLRSDGETLDTQSLYNDEFDMKRFNASLEYGAAIRINRFQINFTTSKGFVNMSGDNTYKVKQNKLINISASVHF